MRSVKNVADMLVVKSVAKNATAGTHYLNVPFATGEPFVIDENGKIVNATNVTSPKFSIGVKRSDGTLYISDMFDATSVKYISVQKYVAPTTKVQYIGYNGVSGSIDLKSYNDYTVALRFTNGSAIQQAEQYMVNAGYKSDSTPTQREIVESLVDLLVKTFNEIPQKKFMGVDAVLAYRVNDGSGVATSGGTITTVAGSKYITIAESASGANDAGKYDSDTKNIAVGDYLRLGTANTAPVFKVVSVSGIGTALATIELDQPTYLSATYTAANVLVIASASIGNNWGIKLVGGYAYYSFGKFPFEVINWELNLGGFGTTIVTNEANASEGSGNGKQVADIERQFKASRGNWYLNSVPAPTIEKEADFNTNYAMIVISAENVTQHAIGNKDYSLKELYIACEKGNGTAYSDSSVGLGTTLNAIANKYGIKVVTSGSSTIATEINA